MLIAMLLAGLPLAGQPQGPETLTQSEAEADPSGLRELRQRAANGDGDALFRLGEIYRYGRGVAVDLKIAEDFYFRASQAGNKDAGIEYGMLLFRRGRQHDAMPWIVAAAERGDARAQYVYGTALFNGDYVTRDWTKAYQMMTRAAAAGIEAANASLAQMTRYMSTEDRQALKDAPATASAAKPVQTASRTPLAPKPVPAAPAAAPPTPERSKPVPKPAPARTATGGWQVQLGAFGDPAKARRLWADTTSSLPAFAGLTPSYVPAGALTRLRAGPLADRQAAERLCATARAEARPCIPVAP